MIRRAVLVGVVSGLALASCGGGGNIEGTSWVLSEMGEGSLPTGSVVTLSFSSDTARGSGGCNEYFGDYETSGDSITFGPLASTRKACGQGLDDQEFSYLSALQSAETYEASADRLEINHSGGTLVYTAAAS